MEGALKLMIPAITQAAKAVAQGGTVGIAATVAPGAVIVVGTVAIAVIETAKVIQTERIRAEVAKEEKEKEKIRADVSAKEIETQRAVATSETKEEVAVAKALLKADKDHQESLGETKERHRAEKKALSDEADAERRELKDTLHEQEKSITEKTALLNSVQERLIAEKKKGSNDMKAYVASALKVLHQVIGAKDDEIIRLRDLQTSSTLEIEDITSEDDAGAGKVKALCDEAQK